MSHLFRSLLAALRGRPVSSSVSFDDGLTLVASAEGLSVGGALPVEWWQVQMVRWVADLSVVSVSWTDPGRERVVGVVSGDVPRAFLEDVNEFLRASMVTFRSARAANGSSVTVQVRRDGAGDLVSVVTADGPLDAQGEALADELERSVREAVGLDF